MAPQVSSGRKRKAERDTDEDVDDGAPRKRLNLPPIGEEHAPGSSQPQPLHNNLSAGNVHNIPTRRRVAALPKSRVPSGSRPPTRTTRSTSAPPRPLPTRQSSRTAPAPKAPTGRIASINFGHAADQRLQAIQSQVQLIETTNSTLLEADMDAERQRAAELHESNSTITSQLAAARTTELAQRRELVNASDEIDALRRAHARKIMDMESDVKKREREIRELNEDLRVVRSDLEQERNAVSELKGTIARQETERLTLQVRSEALKSQIGALQNSFDFSAETVSKLKLDLEAAKARVAELEEEAREAEMVRRRLHNMVQELKGNIRVFCRVRPVLPSDIDDFKPSEDEEERKARAMAKMSFPDTRDHREILLSSSSESATGHERRENWNFTFDRVFEPHCTQEDVFEDISQLAQSCTDGYNVCIFAYGQTGSGKSFTMEGGSAPHTVGMIPRAVEQVFRVAEELKPKGWEYTMEGQFLEIYNETINDLLGKGEFDKKKHEIKHEKGNTRVTDVVVKQLTSPTQVRSLLALANSRRTVAATLMNERSSRSHSVFTLRIRGKNSHTGEECKGALNLVDLAGSERLNASGAGKDKERLKETQAINKSLSALGDVIAALGEKSEKSDKHIPYRNSKLTYLLQNSLSGNSKTLMVLNLSPLATHLNESLCSLRFATKVNNTQIGTAKKQVKSS